MFLFSLVLLLYQTVLLNIIFLSLKKEQEPISKSVLGSFIKQYKKNVCNFGGKVLNYTCLVLFAEQFPVFVPVKKDKYPTREGWDTS